MYLVGERSRLVLSVNEEPYRMVGAAIGAGPGALEGARGWAGAAATFVACVSSHCYLVKPR